MITEQESIELSRRINELREDVKELRTFIQSQFSSVQAGFVIQAAYQEARRADDFRFTSLEKADNRQWSNAKALWTNAVVLIASITGAVITVKGFGP